MSTPNIDRRSLLRMSAGLAGAAFVSTAVGPASRAGQTTAPRLGAATEKDKPVDRTRPTRLQIACMTLPYSAFPLERALTGLKEAGYRFVALGISHKEDSGKSVPVLAKDAAPEKAKELAKRRRDLGLEPVMMFSETSPENVEAMKFRLKQAAAGGVAQVLTMGSSRGNDPKVWVRVLKELGPVARDLGVLLVVKQHGGNTGTGAGLGEIVREVNDKGIKISYDAGNVSDYSRGKVNPLEDIRTCADEIRSFCIKDHRFFPKDQDCGPGLGEIDHYRLLAPVAFTGLTMPLCCENISAPAVARPAKPEGIDVMARRAREYLELVIEGLQAP